MFRTDQTVIAPEWQAVMRACGLDSVEAVYRCNAGKTVTSSGSTQVLRVEVSGSDGPSRTLYVKKYWFNSSGQRWRGMLRGTFFGRSKVRREFENLARLRQWELDAPAPVAYGEERSGRWLTRSFLISEGISDALPLHQFIRDVLPRLPPAEQHQLRRELIERLADYTRRLHEHRFVHGDYYWRNIILSGASLKRFFLIDAHKGRCWRPWEEERRRALDLAALDAPAPAFFRRTERLRFFLVYRGHRALTPEDKSLLKRTLQLAEPMREPQLRRVARRAPGSRTAELRHSADLASRPSARRTEKAAEHRRPAGFTGNDLLIVERQVRDAFERLQLTTCAAAVRFFTEGRPVKPGVLIKPAELTMPDGSKLQAFYKQYEYASPSWHFFCRRSKARAEFESYGAFARLGIPCAERLAVGEMRDGLGRLLHAFILTRAIAGARTLTEFVQQECPDRHTLASRTLRNSLLRQLAVLTRRLHDGGFFHNDLYWRNILVTWDRAAEPRLWWIDCPRGRYALFRRAHPRLKDLACLDKMASRLCTRAERLEFVKQYLGKNAIDVETREWAAATDRYRRRRWRDEGAGENGARFSPPC
jgi:tRNA A-37 threonylcarbamoyl transferase component Bud32